MAETQDLTRLTTFQHHIDDMRNLVMCKICLKPLYEPFILSCGHTYCYGCLRSWFKGLDGRKRKKNCPDCRTEVWLTPSPNYILRDLVHMFIGRAELLPEDETVDEHLAGKITEAELLSSDKDGKGIFDGLFKSAFHPIAAYGPMRDDEDEGIYRCPSCFHEVVEGFCTGCGLAAGEHDGEFSDEEDDSLTVDDDSIVTDEDGSDVSDHNVRYGLPRHFFSRSPAAGDDHSNIGTDGFSEPEYGTPHWHEHDEDDEDMEGFIDDQEVDEPDEVDEDDDIWPPPNWAHRRARVRRALDQILDDEEDTNSPDEDEVELANFQRNYRQNNWHPGGPVSSPGEESEEDVNDQERLTNYDESDDGSRSATPVAIPIAQRRRPIVISDSDDEDEENGASEDENVPDSSRGEDLEQNTDDEEVSEESSDSNSDPEEASTPSPPQTVAARRHRLNEIRKRRRTPEARNVIHTDRTQPAYSRRW